MNPIAVVKKIRKKHVLQAMKRIVEEEKKLLALRARLEKRHGQDVLTSFAKVLPDIKCVPTGFKHLDDLLTGEADADLATIVGTGRGLPRGRIIEIGGKEGSGKTSLLLWIVACFQKQGLRCAIVDAEHAIDPRYAKKIGVRMEDLLFNQPGTAEEALQVAVDFVESGLVDFVAVDSVAALTPEDEVEGDVGDQQVGLQARLMGKGLRKLKGIVNEKGTIVVFINQLRAKIGGFTSFRGPQEQTAGGNPLRFFADIRIDVRVVRQIRKGTTVIGIMSVLRTIKNKVAPPFRKAFLEIDFRKGPVAVHPDDDRDSGKEDEGE